MDGGDDESRAELYRSMLDRFQSLEDNQQKLRQQFEVVLQEETRKNLSSKAEKRPASDSGDVTSFPGWGFLPGAYFSGSPYRNVLMYMGHGVHVCSRTRSWEFTYWNRAAEKLYGYKDHEVVGQRDIKLLFNEEHHHSALAIMKRLTNGESWSGQLPLKKRSGQTFMAMVTMSPLYENGELVGIVTVSSDGAVFNEKQSGNMKTHQEQEHSKVCRIDFKKSSQWHHQRPQIVTLPQLPSSISNLASKILLRNRSKQESEEAEVESRDVKADRPPKAPMAKFISKLQIGAVSNLEKVMDESFQQKSSEDNSTKEAAYEACLQRDSMENTSHISNLNANNHIKDAPPVTSDAVQRKQHAARSTTDDNSTGGAFLSAYERCSVKSVDEEDASPRMSGSRRTPSSVVESEIRWEDLQFKEEIGQGSFAVVYHGIWNGSDVAVKVYYGNEYTEQVLLDYRKEIDIMRRLRHPNVLLFMGAVCTEEKLAIVTEYMPRGSLFKTIHRNNQALDIRRCLRMAIDVARGMNYLHHRNPPIVHRDLKSSNLLVDKSWTVKVGDFGLSKLKCATFLTTRSGRGTPQWMAPEVLRNEPSTEKSDVFSFGVILWELMTERVPWSELNSLQVVGVVGFMDRRLDLPEDIDPQVSSIISDCWQSKPDDRPSFEDIILKMTELVQPGSGLTARSASVP